MGADEYASFLSLNSFIVRFMDLADIRRLVIVAMFSDDVLFNRLVLKGGNAISLIYGFGNRGSLDVDFSIDGDFDDLEDTERRVKAALADRFRSAGHVLFDYSFVSRPSIVGAKGIHRRFQADAGAVAGDRHVAVDQRRAELDAVLPRSFGCHHSGVTVMPRHDF